ncbi:MAG: hypothetical protein NC313_07995 [Butyrivibrio sp.]|nr:hypothetical protein [Butyrivibrio sp.]
MLHILLLILKIILIILAILIGVILLSLCIVLFVPVHYSVKLNRTEGEGSPPIEADAKITWLLHFINIRAVYPSDMYLKVRIMFITLFRLPMKEKKAKKERKEKTKANKDNNEDKKTKTNGKDKNEDKVQETDARTDKEKAAGEKISVAEKKVVGEKISADKETIAEKSAGAENENDTDQEINTADKTDTAGTESGQSAQDAADACGETESVGKAKQSLKDKIKAKINDIKAKLIKIIDIFKNIIYTIKKICVKIKEMLENAEYYRDIIKGDEFKRAFSLCKDELVAIFSYIKPRKFRADLIIGLDDPASTGQVLSYYGILYPLIGNNVNVTGDFERKRIEGSVFIKGKIKLFTFLKAVIRIYFNKDIRKLLKLFKKEEA